MILKDLQNVMVQIVANKSKMCAIFAKIQLGIVFLQGKFALTGYSWLWAEAAGVVRRYRTISDITAQPGARRDA